MAPIQNANPARFPLNDSVLYGRDVAGQWFTIHGGFSFGSYFGFPIHLWRSASRVAPCNWPREVVKMSCQKGAGWALEDLEVRGYSVFGQSLPLKQPRHPEGWVSPC